MAEGGKKAGVAAGGLLAAFGAFMAHGVDDCARLGARSAMRGADDVVIAGARGSGDDLARLGIRSGDDLGSLGLRSGDELAEGALGSRGQLGWGVGEELGAAGESGVRSGRSGSFGGGRFGRGTAPRASQVAELRARGALELTDDELDELTELIVDVGVDVAEGSAEWVIDELSDDEYDEDDEENAVRILAIGQRAVSGADRTLSTFAQLRAELDAADALPVVLVAEARPGTDRIRVAPTERAPRLARPLAHCARLGQSCVVVVCRGEDVPGERPCLEEAARVVRAAAAGGRSGFAQRLTAARDRSGVRSRVALLGLRDGESGLRMHESPATPR